MQYDIDQEYELYRQKGRIWGMIPRERIRAIRFPRVPAETVDAYLALHDLTTTVSDILDSVGLHTAVSSYRIPGLVPGARIAGTSVTLRNIPERKTATQSIHDGDSTRMSIRDAYYLGEKGDVLVVDFGGNPDISNLGGQAITSAKTAGFAGVVVNGAVRDLPTIRNLDFPVWARGATPITGKFRIETMEINGPVTVHDVAVQAGDLVLGDDNGLCFVPAELVDDVLRRAQEITAKEERVREQTAQAKSSDELRALITSGD